MRAAFRRCTTIALGFSTVACGDRTHCVDRPVSNLAASGACVDGPMETGVAQLVASTRELAPQAAAERILAGAIDLDARLRDGRRKVPVDSLASALICLASDGRIDVIDNLDRLLVERGHQDVKYTVTDFLVGSSSGDARVRALRAHIALRRPEDLRLAPFREGGLEYLLIVAEDRGRDAKDRYEALIALASHGTQEMRERIGALVADATPIPGLRNLQVGKPRPTIGSAAAEALERMGSRNSDSTSRPN